MPYIHLSCHEDVTAFRRQSDQRLTRPATAISTHAMDVRAHKSLLLRDELRLHTRYIRDTLVPLLSRQPRLTPSDTVLLRSIFKKLESTHITLDLLRYSRIEKALMVIAATGAATVRFSDPSLRFMYRASTHETLEGIIGQPYHPTSFPGLDGYKLKYLRASGRLKLSCRRKN